MAVFGVLLAITSSVKAATIVELAPHAPLPPGPRYTPKPTITLDYAAAPEFGPWMEQVAKPLLEQWYPVLGDYYAYPHHHEQLISAFTLSVDPTYTGVAATNARERHIWISADYLRNHMDDGGLLIHEAMHLIQFNPATGANGLPGWITEGWADHAREKVYQDRPFRAPTGDEIYLSGYGRASFLLEQIERATPSDFMKDLSAKGWEGAYYNEALFTQLSGASASWWWFKITGQATSDLGSIKHAASERCVALPGSSTDGTHVQLRDCRNLDMQKWLFKATSGDSKSGIIIGSINRRCLALTNNAVANGSEVAYKDCNSSANPGQKWEYVNGTLRNPASGKCLQPVDETGASGTTLTIHTCSDTATQQWKLPEIHQQLHKLLYPIRANGVTALGLSDGLGNERQLFAQSDGSVYRQAQLAPDGRRVAYYVESANHASMALHVGAVSGAESQQLPLAGYYLTAESPAPLWTPDGAQLLVAAKLDVQITDNWTWLLVAADGSSQQVLAETMTDTPFAITQERVYFFRKSPDQQPLCFINRQDGATNCFGSSLPEKAASLVPSGDQIASLDAGQTTEIRLSSTDGQASTTIPLPGLGSGFSDITDIAWAPHSSHIAFRAIVDGKTAWYTINSAKPQQVHKLNTTTTEHISWWANSEFTLARGAYTALSPTRITDTRPHSGLPNAGKALSAQSTLSVQVAGVGGVPAQGVGAVVLNITHATATTSSYLTVFPHGRTRPVASTLNVIPGQTANNQTTVGLGEGGKVDIFNAQGVTNVVVDVVGYYGETGSTFTPTSPIRLLDTRSQYKKIPAGDSLQVAVANTRGIPAHAVGIVADVTEVNASQNGFLTLYPAGTSRPAASSVNYQAGKSITKEVNVKLGAEGAIAIANPVGGPVDVVIDVVGYYTADASGMVFAPLAPVRIADTRTGSGAPYAGQSIGPNSTRHVSVPAAALPANASALLNNLTVASASTGTYVATFPASISTPPPATAVTFTGDVACNQNTVLLSDGPYAGFKVFNKNGTANVIVDALGYFY